MKKTLQAKSKDKWQTGKNIIATYIIDKALTFLFYKAFKNWDRQKFIHIKNVSAFKPINFIMTREKQIKSSGKKFFQLYCMFEKFIISE